MNLKCRTCLGELKLISCLHFSTKVILNKSISEILHNYIPDMIKSSLVDNFICDNCVISLRNFERFIKRVLAVEKYLREEDLKQKQKSITLKGDLLTNPKRDDENRSTNILRKVSTDCLENLNNGRGNTKVNNNDSVKKSIKIVSISNKSPKPLDLLEDKQKLIQDRFQVELIDDLNEVRRKSEERNNTELTKPTMRTYARKKRNLQKIPHKEITPLTVSNKLTAFLTKEHYNTGNIVTDILEDDLPNSFLEDALESTSTKLNNLESSTEYIFDNEKDIQVGCETVIEINSDKSNSPDFCQISKNSQVETIDSKAVLESSHGNKAFDSSLIENLNLTSIFQSSDITKTFTQTTPIEYLDLNMILEDNNFFKVNVIDPNPATRDVNLVHNRVISMTKTNEDIVEFLSSFNKYEVNFLKKKDLKNSPTKRLILLGNSFVHCPECKIRFKTHIPMKTHFNLVHRDKEYPTEENFDVIIKSSMGTRLGAIKDCPVCGARFNNCRMLTKHLSQEHKDYYKFSCEHCGKKFKKNSLLKVHLKNYEKFKQCKIRRCIVCKELIPKEGYRSHLDIHRTIPCNLCERKFATTNFLKKHLKRHQNSRKKKPMRKMLCNICGKLVISKSNLTQHMQTHTSHRRFLCEKCPKTFKSFFNVQKHLKIVHGNIRRFKCTLCESKVKTASAMKFHMKLKHSDAYSFVCHVCGEKFVREDYYKRHLARHNLQYGANPVPRKRQSRVYYKEDKFPCKYCDKVYTKISSLKVHLLNSHWKNGPRYKCQYCSWTFKTISNKQRHEKRHENPEAFELTCKVCYNRFNSQEMLEAHSLKHEGSQRRVCEECGETFPSKYLLVHHAGQAHFDQYVADIQKEILLKEGLEDFESNCAGE